MKLETLDNVVRSALTSNGLSIHWYFDFLHSAIRCLRELNLDIMRNVNSVILTPDANASAPLPCDYVDFVRVGFAAGQMVVPMSQKNDINNLPNRNAAGAVIPYNLNDLSFPYQMADILGYGYYYWYLNSFNVFGENTGGFYGFKGSQIQSFKVLTGQCRIQFDQNITAKKIFLDYISDGFGTGNCSAVTMVSPYAVDAIEKYITTQYYKSDPVKAKFVALAENDYYLAVKKLIARMNPLTAEDIRASFRKGYQQTNKAF